MYIYALYIILYKCRKNIACKELCQLSLYIILAYMLDPETNVIMITCHMNDIVGKVNVFNGLSILKYFDSDYLY